MSSDFGGEPVRIDAGRMTWRHRPRLYWVTWELSTGPGVTMDSSGEVEVWTLVGRPVCFGFAVVWFACFCPFLAGDSFTSSTS